MYKRIQLWRVCDGYNDALWSLWYIVYAHHRYLWSTYISWIYNALWALCRCIELSSQQTRKRCHWKPHFSSLRNAPTDTTGSKVIRTQLFYLSNIWSWLTYACQARSATDIQFIWIRVAVNKLVITVEHWMCCRVVQYMPMGSVLTDTGKQSKMDCKSYISHHCWLHDVMHNAKDHPLCKQRRCI